MRQAPIGSRTPFPWWSARNRRPERSRAWWIRDMRSQNELSARFTLVSAVFLIALILAAAYLARAFLSAKGEPALITIWDFQFQVSSEARLLWLVIASAALGTLVNATQSLL